MIRNLKKANLFAFSILMFSGLFSLSLNNDLNLKSNNKELQSHGVIIDFEAGQSSFGVTVDTDLDGFADTLYMWGNNDYGQIGNGASGSNVVIPTIIEPEDGWNGNIIDLSLGDDNTSGATVDTDYDGYADTLYIWGSNDYGEIGNGQSGTAILTPIMIEDQSFWNGSLLDLNTSFDSSGILVDTDYDGFGDKLYMWGNNSYGQLGWGNDENSYIPILISSDNKITDFDLGGRYSGAIVDNNLYTWGQIYEEEAVYVPTINSSSSENPNWLGDKLLSINFSENDFTLLSDSNDDNIADNMWVWGSDSFGEIISNDESFSTVYQPILSDFSEDDDIINVASSGFSSGIITDSDNDGKGDRVFTRGLNQHGELGNNNIADQDQFGEIFFKDTQGQQINGNFSKIVMNFTNSGLLADLNDDGYNDTIYLWGDNHIGQIENGTSGENIITPYLAISFISLDISSIDFSTLDNQSMSIVLVIKDPSDIYNEENIPTIKIKDSDENELAPIIDEENSDFSADTYVYTLSGLNPGTEYDFNLITFNDKTEFEIDQKIITDYLISGVSLNNLSANTATLDLNLSLNNDFNYSNFDESQRQVKINLDDQTSIESVINANDQIVINNLNSSTSYNITSIDYNFDEDTSSYKYNILTPNLSFDTADFNLILEANTFLISDSSITASSFIYTVDINNLDKDEANGGFTNFDPNDGLYLIDDDYNSYQTTYIEDSEEEIGIGQEQNTFEYQFSFQINNLNSDRTYDFIGISLISPLSQDDPSIVSFDNNVLIKTEKDKNNLAYLWAFIGIILVLLIIILLATSFNLILKKRNVKMVETLNTVTSKS